MTPTTLPLVPADWLGLVFFAAGWVLFSSSAEGHVFRRASLTVAMNRQREIWIHTMARRELRMIDTSIMTGLQQGTAFFASSSLIALGSCFALLGSPDNLISLLSEVPYADAPTRQLFELKVLGLILLLAFAFFKFGWAYRLFNYCSILIGAVPPVGEFRHDGKAAERAVSRAATMNVLAGKHFSAGLRAVFFSVAYLGWFVGPLALIAATVVLLAVLARRQFFSAARAAVIDGLDAGQPAGDRSGEASSSSVRPDRR
jgi:uncharacterized membrane protein